MRTSVVPKGRELSQQAERQMRTWALSLQMAPAAESGKATPIHKLFHPYIAISRQAGVDAGAVAHAVAGHLAWKVLDREILDFLAEKHNWSRVSLDFVDERSASWYHDTLGKWLDSKLISQAEYVIGLARVIVLAARHESLVVVGRGAQFILPREAGLTVRLLAPRKHRLAQVMEEQQVDAAHAKKMLDETDRGRADFVRRYFHHDPADPELYDLVINLEHLSYCDAADLIVKTARLRFSPPSGAAPPG